MEKLDITLADGDPPKRLDAALAAAWPEISRARFQRLIRDGQVRLDGEAIRDPSARVAGGANLSVTVPPPEPAEPAAEPIPLNVVFEDNDLIVVDKPAGLVVHPGAGTHGGTLVNALLHHAGDSLSGIGGVARPGIVHRLDKDTSGLIVVAKTDAAHRSLSAQFADHGRSGPLERAYKALVWDVPARASGTIDAPLGRDPRSAIRMAIRKDGRRAVTHWHRDRHFTQAGRDVAALVECRLETGRTHQIRVHMASIGNPVMGDPVYASGFKSKAALLGEPARDALEALNRQALHAFLLSFRHPGHDKVMRFESPLPDDMSRLADALDTP